jgi:hypothetical protein
MDTVEAIRSELEKCVSAINSIGLDSVDLKNIDVLNTCAAAAGTLGMNSGKKLIDNLAAALKSFKDGKTSEESVQVRLTALDFYLKKLSVGAVEEEL